MSWECNIEDTEQSYFAFNIYNFEVDKKKDNVKNDNVHK